MVKTPKCVHDVSGDVLQQPKRFQEGSVIAQVLEYPEAVQACAICHHLCDLGTCLFNCFFFFFFFFFFLHSLLLVMPSFGLVQFSEDF